MKVDSLPRDPAVHALDQRSSTRAQVLQHHVSQFHSWKTGAPTDSSVAPPNSSAPGTKATPPKELREPASAADSLPVQPNPISTQTEAPWDAAQASEWCAQMVCYLWYAKSASLPHANHSFTRVPRHRSESQSDLRQHSAPHTRVHTHRSAHSVSSLGSMAPAGQARIPSRHQLYPTERFYTFVKDVLRMTQVSKTVIAFSLLYIYRLKVRHPNLEGQLGSEYRLFLTSLVLANKFLDDHTYTNKTWSDVSRIPLKEITKMELQLWGGIDTNASATVEEYAWWQSTLDQLTTQRSLDQRWLNAPDVTPALSPSSSFSDASSVSTGQHFTPSPSAVVEARPPWSSGQTPTPAPLANTKDYASFRATKRRRASDADEEGLARKIQRDVLPGDVPNMTVMPSMQAPPVVSAQDNRSMRSLPRLVMPPGLGAGAVGSRRTPSPEARRSQMVPSPSERSNLWDAKMSHACGTNAMGLAPELLLPFESLSPFSTPHVNASSASPMVFGYYRLAAGYSHGIPAYCMIHPMGLSSQNTVGACDPVSLGGVTTPLPAPVTGLPSESGIQGPTPDYLSAAVPMSAPWGTATTVAHSPWQATPYFASPEYMEMPATNIKPTALPVNAQTDSLLPPHGAVMGNPVYNLPGTTPSASRTTGNS
ncbi:hypothetical protein MBRA1_000067 [Malassezia brasiliensis]|uniref:Cyclin N-terminal domain-containing protein n=1 Tax=Malassezia brasiliensis TaxID=1821822 RepID=A0AAF0DQB7_9BASI|nr:hypothetical protein MBRA1_000067 [Malassezia brasiliensis]